MLARHFQTALTSKCITLYVLLEDFLKRREEPSFERLNHLRVDLARDLDGQTQRLEQVVVEVRLARILKWKKHQYDSVHFDEEARLV